MIRQTNDQIYNESQFLQYVLYVLKDSRSKRHAEGRISGLINKRLLALGSLVEFDESMIKNYLEQETEKKENQTKPPKPSINFER